MRSGHTQRGGASYEQPLQEQLRRLIQANAQLTGTDQPGGVFVRPSRDIPDEDLTLILTVARVVLIAARGNLAQQLGSSEFHPACCPALRPTGQFVQPACVQRGAFGHLPFLELPYFNGLGGFTPDGKEYVIYLGPGRTRRPLPWINVMANPRSGRSCPNRAWAIPGTATARATASRPGRTIPFSTRSAKRSIFATRIWASSGRPRRARCARRTPIAPGTGRATRISNTTATRSNRSCSTFVPGRRWRRRARCACSDCGCATPLASRAG